MKKYVCAVCGWTTEADVQPAECPICKAKKFTEHEIGGELVYAAEHKVGICEGIDEEIIKGLRENFTGECNGIRRLFRAIFKTGQRHFTYLPFFRYFRHLQFCKHRKRSVTGALPGPQNLRG